jgi:hypothetical protein
MNFVIIVDLEEDLCEFYYNGTLMHSYQWTLGCFGTPGLLQLGGMNMYAWASTGNSPLYYFDDVLFTETYEEPVRDHIGYNVYLDGILETPTPLGIDVFEYQYTGLTPDQTYIAGVSAVYDEGESEIVEFPFTYTPVTTFDPPENLVATVVNYNEVELVWEAPGGVTGEWLFYHDGTFEMGLASTAGGAGIAQMFQPDSYPCTIEQIEYFVSQEGVNGQEMEVWIIADDFATVLGGPYTANAVLDWNTVDIDDIVITSGGFLIATYNVLASGPYVGCDDSLYDGTLYFGSHTGGFTELGVYGYYYVGSHGAYVSYGSDSIVAKHQVLKPTPVAPARFSSNVQLSVVRNAERKTNTSYATRESRYLSGYKVYRNAVEIAEITDPSTLTYADDAGLDTGNYEYYVTAIYTDPAGESDPSNIESVEIILPIPQNAEATYNYPMVVVTWNPISDGRDFVIYNVYRDGVQVGTATNTMYPDPDLPSGEYTYNITAEFDGGYESDFSNDAPVVVTESDNILIPVRTELTGNYPNPFNPETKIKFSLNKDSDVSIKIYNIKGAVVRTLVNGEMNAAYHEIIWDGKDNAGKQVGSGVYFYKMKAEKYTATKKMILMK